MEAKLSNKLFERALLIEDDTSHAILVRRALVPLVSDLNEATSLATATDLISKMKFDLILTDLHLADGASEELIKSLVKFAPDTPIVVLTSSTLLNDAIAAMKHGARDFLVKDFGSTFHDVLGLALHRVKSAIALETKQVQMQRDMGVLRIAIENSNDGLAVVRSDAMIEYSNASFLSFVQLCGGNTDGLLNVLGPQVKNSTGLIDNLRLKMSSLPTGAVWHTEILFSEHKERAFDFSLSAVEGQDSPVNGVGQTFVVWLRDISEQKRREKFQRELLSTTTHDLKGPLGAIIISAELLCGMLQEVEKPRELALRIGSSAHGAVNLIDEFLSARRIQEGSLVLRPAFHSAQKLLSDIGENFGTIAAARGIELSFECQPETVTANVDRLGFIRVVGNLISNALKFTQRGGKVTVRAFSSSAALHIQVTDSGSGIDPSELKKLFQRFGRLEQHQDVAGTGIGLFVVRSVVTAHGGSIDVTSKLGHGSTFEVTFPDSPPVNERGEIISLDFA